METKETITYMLKETNRTGIEDVMEFLSNGNFFSCPASTRFHGNFEGGLAQHSLNVYDVFLEFLDATELLEKVPTDSIVITTLLHDVCKMGAYLPNSNNGGFHWNKQQPPGHGSLSVKRLMSLIELSPLEQDLIRFHMGPWGTLQMIDKGDYTIVELKEAWNRNLATRFLYFADETATVTEPVK